MNGQLWGEEDRQIVRWLYPHVPTKDIANLLGRRLDAVYQIAVKMGLQKTPEYLSSAAACRLRRGDHVGAPFWFRPGHVPANKGLRRPGWAPGRMAETQFKKGQRTGAAARNWRPIGTILPDADGYLRIKVREAAKGEAFGFGNSRVWPQLHRYRWEQAHGPIPTGHALVFKDRDKSNVSLDNLELLSRRELMARNTVHNLPKDLVEVIQLTGALKRKLRRRQREEQAI